MCVSVYNVFIGGKTCCLSSKNILYMCTRNLSQNCSKRKRLSFGNKMFPKQILCVYMAYSFFECNAIYEYFPTYLFNIHTYKLYIGIFPRESIY